MQQEQRAPCRPNARFPSLSELLHVRSLGLARVLTALVDFPFFVEDKGPATEGIGFGQKHRSPAGGHVEAPFLTTI